MAPRDEAAEARRAAERGADRLAAKLRGLGEQAKATRSTGLRVPEQDADPAAGEPTNLWLMADGRLRSRTLDGIVHEYPPATAAGSATSTKPKPADTAPTRKQRIYDASWAKTYCPVHGVEGGGNLRYGRFDGTHGERRIMFGLPDATIRADLANSTIRAVDLHLRNTDSWAYSGIEIAFGGHNRSAQPAGFSAVRRNVWTGHWPASGDGAYWRSGLELIWFARMLRDDVIKGITVDQGSSITRYGELDWSTLRLRVTYTS